MPRPGRGGMSLEKSKDFKGAILRLLKSLSPWKVIMIVALVLAMTGAIVSLIAPHKLSEFADLIRVGLMGQDIDMKAIKELAIFMGGLYVTSAICQFIQGYSLTTVSNRFAHKLRDSISKKINKLPLKYFDSHEAGDVLSRVTNDVDTVSFNLNNSLATLVTSITLFSGAVIMMFVTNWIMALTAILSSLIGFFFMFSIASKNQKYFAERQEQLGNMNGFIEEMYSGHNVVKVYNGTKEALIN